MKISITGLAIEPGKVKYQDIRFQELVQRFAPDKLSPFTVELLDNQGAAADALVVSRSRLLDLLIPDMERLENRLRNDPPAPERALIERCLSALESETPICDVAADAEEQALLRVLAPLSAKPVVVLDALPDSNQLITAVLQKAQIVFFFTAGKKEVKAWPVKAGSDIVTCAGKIHSDLARGFIKADVVNFADFMRGHNMQDARSRGVVRLVDRDYRIADGDIIEIRFSV